MRGYLGWDVGAWHCQGGGSRDALVLLAGEGAVARPHGHPWRGNLRETYNGAAGSDLLGALVGLVGAAAGDFDEAVVAIDTPLGWPDAFHDLLEGRVPDVVPDSKATNPLLMRATERWLSERGHRPLSAVQDLIGSQATKGMSFLGRLGLRPERPGVWSARLGATRVVAFEAYPSPCAYSPTIQGARAPHAGPVPASAHDDVQDALTCAVVAWAFTTHPEWLAAPSPGSSTREGWIWVPSDCLNPKDAAA